MSMCIRCIKKSENVLARNTFRCVMKIGVVNKCSATALVIAANTGGVKVDVGAEAKKSVTNVVYDCQVLRMPVNNLTEKASF